MSKNSKKNIKEEKTTKYGEQIPSQFAWITPEEQKNKADELNKISKEK